MERRYQKIFKVINNNIFKIKFQKNPTNLTNITRICFFKTRIQKISQNNHRFFTFLNEITIKIEKYKIQNQEKKIYFKKSQEFCNLENLIDLFPISEKLANVKFYFASLDINYWSICNFKNSRYYRFS